MTTRQKLVVVLVWVGLLAWWFDVGPPMQISTIAGIAFAFAIALR